MIWTDANGKLDYDSALEDMVRDARVILAREMRHAILKITGGEEKDTPRSVAVTEQASEPPAPMTTSEELHERNVAAEQHEHERAGADGKDQED